jgi:hypothetical protein
VVRAIERINRHPVDGTWYLMECGHIIIKADVGLGDSQVIKRNSVMIFGIYCPDCARASSLPNTVVEIWEKYWKHRNARREGHNG